jgi:hypothetical protein
MAEDRNLSLRVASSLEQGAEEIVADKPAMVFVQTHLSGLSADILFMHLKKLLGRRRTRFVLLCPGDQINENASKLYQNHIDSSLDDQALADAILATVATLAPRGKKAAGVQEAEPMAAVPTVTSESSFAVPVEEIAQLSGGDVVVETQPTSPVQTLDPGEPSLAEQGLVYTPRRQLSVYSEFTSAYDTAVSGAPEPEPAATTPEGSADAWSHAGSGQMPLEPTRSGSKSARYVLWLVALVVTVVAVTLYQHQGSPSKSAPKPDPKSVEKPPASAAQPGEPAKTAAPAPLPGDAAKPQAVGHGDQAMLSAMAENRTNREQKPSPAIPRPTALPDFIPRAGLDKGYGAANPGWELYKGLVTEFKIFREGTTIKAIQVIDRGGQGIPESFMKGVLGHLAKTPSFSLTSSEKKEGYEIQRGQVAGNLGAVFYRDAQGGKLRAFVVTWQ